MENAIVTFRLQSEDLTFEWLVMLDEYVAQYVWR